MPVCAGSQTRWLAESCQLYAEGARAISAAETSDAVRREWSRWERVLEGEWATQTGTEEDMACPTTAAELAEELLATMRPVEGAPSIHDSVQACCLLGASRCMARLTTVRRCAGEAPGAPPGRAGQTLEVAAA
jgi:hypothetical protein